MSEQENIKVVRALFDAANAKNLEQMASLNAEDYQAEAPDMATPMNKEQSLYYSRAYFTAFPDLHLEITLAIAQGDYVVVHYRTTATNTGPMAMPSGAMMPPKGKQIDMLSSNTYQLRHGKIIHSWNFYDMATMLGQMGMMPAM